MKYSLAVIALLGYSSAQLGELDTLLADGPLTQLTKGEGWIAGNFTQLRGKLNNITSLLTTEKDGLQTELVRCKDDLSYTAIQSGNDCLAKYSICHKDITKCQSQFEVCNTAPTTLLAGGEPTFVKDVVTEESTSGYWYPIALFASGALNVILYNRSKNKDGFDEPLVNY